MSARERGQAPGLSLLPHPPQATWPMELGTSVKQEQTAEICLQNPQGEKKASESSRLSFKSRVHLLEWSMGFIAHLLHARHCALPAGAQFPHLRVGGNNPAVRISSLPGLGSELKPSRRLFLMWLLHRHYQHLQEGQGPECHSRKWESWGLHLARWTPEPVTMVPSCYAFQSSQRVERR